MTETPFEGLGKTWTEAVDSRPWSYVDIWSPARVTLRATALVVFLMLTVLVMLCVAPMAIIAPAITKRIRKTISRSWLKGTLLILGTRVTVRGTPPKSPFFLVGNHVSWIDFFVTNTLVDAVCVSEAVVTEIPMARTVLKGMDLIVVTRTREKLRETSELMMRVMREGKSLVMAPEATVSPGRRVCHFHSGLFESAVRVGRPVHYASLTVRTPLGWPPATQSVLAPDRDLPVKNPTPEEMELMRQQNRRGFLSYFLGLLSLPYHEYIINFAPEPLLREDRKELARDLRQAVQSIFTPVE